MTPEEKARQQIDRQLGQAGWAVQDYRQMNISAELGVAVRAFPLTTGEADYMLYADGKVIGVGEAKPKGHTVDGVNVGYDVYRIETKITTDGVRLAREPGVFVPHRDRRTKCLRRRGEAEGVSDERTTSGCG